MVRREPLTLERILDAAVAVADRDGGAKVSMRTVGRELGVEAMSLYHHVANKDALLDGMVEWIFARIFTPAPADPWRDAMTARADAARATLSAHPWALGLIESRRAPGPQLLHHHNGVLACLRTNGFTVELAAHAFSVLDAYVFGFVLTEVNLPFDPGESAEAFVEGLGEVLDGEAHPFLVELITAKVVGRDYAYGDEFRFGLDLVLDGLEARLANA